MHFRDKDELLVSGMRDMLRSVHPAGLPSTAKRYEKVISFGLPIFEHIRQQRRIGEAMIGSRGRAIIHEHLQRVLAERIAGDVSKDFQGRRKKPAQMPPDLFAQYVASTFILVLNWWVENRSPLPPEEINDLFRSLILPTLAATLE